jgi:hypothetical protein
MVMGCDAPPNAVFTKLLSTYGRVAHGFINNTNTNRVSVSKGSDCDTLKI